MTRPAFWDQYPDVRNYVAMLISDRDLTIAEIVQRAAVEYPDTKVHAAQITKLRCGLASGRWTYERPEPESEPEHTESPDFPRAGDARLEAQQARPLPPTPREDAAPATEISSASSPSPRHRDVEAEVARLVQELFGRGYSHSQVIEIVAQRYGEEALPPDGEFFLLRVAGKRSANAHRAHHQTDRALVEAFRAARTTVPCRMSGMTFLSREACRSFQIARQRGSPLSDPSFDATEHPACKPCVYRVSDEEYARLRRQRRRSAPQDGKDEAIGKPGINNGP